MKRIFLIVLFCSLAVTNLGIAAEPEVLPAIYSLLLGDKSLKNLPIPDIDPRNENFRPLEKKRFFPFTRQTEYVQIGSGYNGDASNNLYVIDPAEYNFDPANPGIPLADPANVLLDEQDVADFIPTDKKTAASGIMDDDIQDEVAVVTWPGTGPGKLSVIDPGGDPDATAFAVKSIDISLDINGYQDLPYDYDIATGDVDGDGYDEIVIAGSIGGDEPDQYPYDQRRGKLWIIDDGKANFAFAQSTIINGVSTTYFGFAYDRGLDQLKVAVGNVDYDRAAEIAVAYAAESTAYNALDPVPINYSVYELVYGYLVARHEGVSTIKVRKGEAGAQANQSWNYFNIAMGDLDRDSRTEIVIGTRSWDSATGADDETVQVEVIDDAVAGYAKGETTGRTHDYSSVPYVDYFKFFDTVDIDNDKADEIFTGSELLNDIVTGNPLGLQEELQPWTTGTGSIIQHVDFGDVNGDLREDITLLYDDSIIQTIGYRDGTWQSGRTGSTPGGTLDECGTSGVLSNGTIIVSANMDNDSVILEYSGDNPLASPEEKEVAHTTYYGRKNIIAVMAVPPAIKGKNANEHTCTFFGQTTSGSTGVGAEVKLRHGVLVGMEAEIQSGFIVSTTVASLETELKGEIEVTTSVGEGVTLTEAIVYSACNTEDRVIFSAQPYDRYVYTIVSHPDGDLLSREFTLDIPQKIQVFSWSKTYYDEHNDNQLDIGRGILNHTAGDINTYPTVAEKNLILSQSETPLIDDIIWFLRSSAIELFESDDSIPIGEGYFGSTRKDFTLESATYFSGSITANLDWMAKACAGTFCFGATVGFSLGAYSEHSVTEGVEFGSEVPNLPPEYYDQYKYRYGMFGYRQTLIDGDDKTTDEFIVLNYWVEK